MRLVELEQGTDEWLKWREQGIGGSDACAVVGDVGWTSPDELLEIKLGKRVVEENDLMARGRRLEPEARRMYEQIRGIEVRPVCAIHDTYDWLRASLDGLSLDGETVLEIKCPGKWPHHRALYKGVYPRYYKAQLMHQLLVTGAKRVHYFSYRPDDDSIAPCALVEVFPDQAYMKALFVKELAFMRQLETLRSSEGVDLRQPARQLELPEPDLKVKPLKGKRRKS